VAQNGDLFSGIKIPFFGKFFITETKKTLRPVRWPWLDPNKGMKRLDKKSRVFFWLLEYCPNTNIFIPSIHSVSPIAE